MNNVEKKQLVTVLAVLVVIAVIVGGVIVSAKQNRQESASGSTTMSTAAEDSATAGTTATGDYKDGEYEATGDYTSPGGQEEIAITVTLKDGVITDTSAENKATDGEARGYQADFIDGYKDLVVGKKIDEVSLSRVSGSSLTSQGFNDALEQIADQAQA